jgi:hydrogenase maturation protease
MNATAISHDVLIIGYGNTLRGDDGVGWVAGQLLERKLRLDHSVKVTVVQQLTPELVEHISRAGLVIFIDASVVDSPGHISCRRIYPDMTPPRFSHEMGPERLLDWLPGSCKRKPHVIVYTVGGEFFGYRQGLDDAVQSAMPELVARIERLITWWEGRIATCCDSIVSEDQTIHGAAHA